MEMIANEVQVGWCSTYADDGIKCLGKIPGNWKVLRFKNVCQLLVSNVDKHSKVLESPIKLCNYVDVYKNEFITDDIAFMSATATNDEISRYRIKVGDVLITKDSEDWLDIGVPALVKYESKNLVCGYHLAILRPKTNINAGFLYHALLSNYIKFQFSIKANGVTRYGISHGEIQGTFIALPPLKEQIKINIFLEKKIAQINKVISQKERIIELLKERTQILIENAVTHGLNLNARMKNSGIDWIGMIPEHWTIAANRSLFEQRNEPGNNRLPLLSISIHSAVSTGEISDEENIRGKNRIKDESSYKSAMTNDIAFNMMRAWQGAIGAVRTNGMVSPAYIVAKPKKILNSDYFEYLYRTKKFIQQMDRFSKGITDFRKRLYWNEFKQLPTILPPENEQREISEFIAKISFKTDNIILSRREEIAKLIEFKTTLINSAVTGKVRVESDSDPSCLKEL